ncbi:MAG TPA: HEAT repeat domain-containing protein [Planctomycetota bacterium]|nr:HEAT repeat domain-containing protein [Planctomycetota bacterium]
MLRALAVALLLQTEPELDRFVETLRSDEIGIRETAQKGIEQLGASAIPGLRKRIEIETEPEVRARLLDSLHRMERSVYQRAADERWEQGDLEGALDQQALLEGVRPPSISMDRRRRDIRAFLEDRWDPPGASLFQPLWFPSLDDLAAAVQVDRRWILAQVLEWAADEHRDRLRRRSEFYLREEGATVTPILIPWLRRQDPFVRQTACRLLGAIHDDRAVPELERICRAAEEDPAVVQAAREAYRRCTRHEPPSP